MVLRPSVSPLTYDEAERVGVALRRRWKAISGKKKTPRLADEQWADIVQLILRHAAEQVNHRDGLESE